MTKNLLKKSIKSTIQTCIKDALHHLKYDVDLEAIQVSESKEREHGHYATNVALLLGKTLHIPPRDLADKLVPELQDHPCFKQVSVAGPGFINFTLSAKLLHQTIQEILTKKASYGHNTLGHKKSVLVEYVSANPTGPLHVGHGRNAIFGSVLVNLLSVCGYRVVGEYYINDGGRQMQILAASVWIRYLQEHKADIPFPDNGYQGDYVVDIAKQLKQSKGPEYFIEPSKILFGLPLDENLGGDKELYIDALIESMKELLGETKFDEIFEVALQTVLEDIKEDLESFGVKQEWFSERTIIKKNYIQETLSALKDHKDIYEKDGALWFRATQYGDEKDRVLIRSNGQPTYFAVDLAYHHHKFLRGFDKTIDIFGADHHGYVPRLKAGLEALGHGDKDFNVVIVQFATLFRGGERVQMSTRSGSFVTLRQLRDEVGKDAGRYFYIARKCDQHMEFDLELATKHTNENPVYYVQYAHARICSVFNQLKAKHLAWDQEDGYKHLALLTSEHEQNLMLSLLRYPDMIETAGRLCEPHQIAQFLQTLAHEFHTYYNAEQFMVKDDHLRSARLCLVAAVKQVIANSLDIIGISAPEQM